MCDCCCCCFSSKSKLKCETDPHKRPLIANGDDYDGPTTAMALLLTSWLHGRRLRYLILALCLPLLIPIVLVSIPVVCAVEICFRSCRRRCKRFRVKLGSSRDVEGGEVVMELNLLDRYLDDQLGLVLEVACEYDTGGDGNLLC